MALRDARLASLRRTISRVGPDVVLSMRVFDAYEAVAGFKQRNLNDAPRLAIGVRAFEAPYISDVRRCRQNIDLCVTSGELIAEACRTIGKLEPSRVVSIGGGVRSPVKNVCPRTPSGTIQLLYAGRLEQHQKRCLDLIPLVNGLQAAGIDFALDVCGAGPEEQTLRTNLQDVIQSGVVRMHGWVTQEQLYENFYPVADCFVHLAAWEGVTISPREAMAHGCVPVISEFTGIHVEQQFRHQHNSLLFPVGRPQVAVERICELCTSAGLMRHLSENAMKSQTGKYSFDGALNAWRTAFEGCLQATPQFGPFPSVPEHLSGRLSQWGVPTSAQLLIRRLLNRPVSHSAAGSEWPTASGLMTAAEEREIVAFAEQTSFGKVL